MSRSHPPSAPEETARIDTGPDRDPVVPAHSGSAPAGAHPPVPADPSRLPGSPLSLDPFTPGALPLPRWFGILVGVSAIGLLPWIVYLAFELPVQSRAAHYDVAWVGFDVAMFAALAVLAVAALKRSTWTEPLAVFTATLLIVDAWFDVVTANNPMRRMEAVTSALLIELPLALVCAWIAHNTERLRRRAYRALWGHVITLRADTGTNADPQGGPTAAGPGSARPGADALHEPQDRA